MNSQEVIIALASLAVILTTAIIIIVGHYSRQLKIWQEVASEFQKLGKEQEDLVKRYSRTNQALTRNLNALKKLMVAKGLRKWRK